jgi:hypothetical protein
MTGNEGVTAVNGSVLVIADCGVFCRLLWSLDIMGPREGFVSPVLFVR